MDASNPAGLVQVPGAGRTLEFEGELIAEVSTEIPRSPRWLEMELYRLTDGTGRYVLHLCGASVVYHKHQGICNTGIPTAIKDMPADARPCTVCHPPPVPAESGSTDMLWDMEKDRHTTYVCQNAEEVIENLKFKGAKSQREKTAGLSAPAERLLDLVAQVDPAFAEVIHEVQRI